MKWYEFFVLLTIYLTIDTRHEFYKLIAVLEFFGHMVLNSEGHSEINVLYFQFVMKVEHIFFFVWRDIRIMSID